MRYSPATLVRLAGNAMIEMFRHADGFEAHITRDSWTIASGGGHPLLNWIGVFAPGPVGEFAFRDAVATMRSRGLGALTFITPDAREGIDAIATELALGESWQVPLMVADLNDLPEMPEVDNLNLIEVTDAVALNDALALSGLAFEMEASAAQYATPAAVLDEPGTRYYAAIRDGETLSMCVLSQFGSIVYVDLMATSPNHQKQGIGRCLLTKALADHIATGARHAFLIASQEGVPLYNRLGFKHEFDGTMYNVAPTSA